MAKTSHVKPASSASDGSLPPAGQDFLLSATENTIARVHSQAAEDALQGPRLFPAGDQ